MTLLEDDVAYLQDEVEDLETDNTQQDQLLITIQENVNDNAIEIDGNLGFLVVGGGGDRI